MPRRRTGEGPDEFEDVPDDDPFGGGFGFGNPFEPPPLGSESGPGIGEIIAPLPDHLGEKPRDFGPPVKGPTSDAPPVLPDDVGRGSTTTARELGGGMPNTIGLPQGVSVNDSMGTMDVPGQSRTPSPVAAQPPNPGFANMEGPRRRSPVSPSIYGETRSPQLFGRADGLLGGGKGLVGAEESSGPIQPTEMFNKLLQLFRRQG